jgi:transcriptional antiterminator NusG
MEIERLNGPHKRKGWFSLNTLWAWALSSEQQGYPVPMSDTTLRTAQRSRKTSANKRLRILTRFCKGDVVQSRGAFENFEGTVDSIDTERGVVRVIVTIFGRSTPLDIEYWQIEKV